MEALNLRSANYKVDRMTSYLTRHDHRFKIYLPRELELPLLYKSGSVKKCHFVGIKGNNGGLQTVTCIQCLKL